MYFISIFMEHSKDGVFSESPVKDGRRKGDDDERKMRYVLHVNS